MIKATELRIGNWLKCNDLFIKVSGISENSFTCTHEGLLYFNSEDCEPIPLSPEILEKCGFKDSRIRYADPNKNYPIEWTNGEYTINKENDNKFCLELSSDEWGYTTKEIEIEYLHQLQNGIFFLTGEELIFKQ